jgi:hypothetical protein
MREMIPPDGVPSVIPRSAVAHPEKRSDERSAVRCRAERAIGPATGAMSLSALVERSELAEIARTDATAPSIPTGEETRKWRTG